MLFMGCQPGNIEKFIPFLEDWLAEIRSRHLVAL
jgi:hypothetical protein